MLKFSSRFYFAVFFFSRSCTASLSSSLITSEATHLADFVPLFRISWASLNASLLRDGFLFPMFLRAQLTAFFIELRSSNAPLAMTGNKPANRVSSAVLSCQAKQASNPYAVRLTNSSSRLDQSTIFFHASGVFSKRFMQTWSPMSHESMSFTQSSICASVSFSGSSTMAATILASAMPVFHSSSANVWFFPVSFAIFRISGICTPSLCSVFMP